MAVDWNFVLSQIYHNIVLWFLMFYEAIATIVKQFIPYQKRCKSIKGETVLITGAGSGLGKSLAKKMAKLETRIICVDVDTKNNEKTVNEIKEAGGVAFAYTCDLSKREEIYKVAEKIKEEVGNVDILVNNAGIVTGKKFLDSSDSAIERTMNVNINAHFWLTKCFLPYMIEKDHGHLVTVASMAGHFGNAGLGDYCASKFAAVGFDESVRLELQNLEKNGVKTTCVCPFFINTGMFEGATAQGIPFLEPDYVTDKMLEAILTDQLVLMLPKLMYFIMFTKGFLPHNVNFYMARHIFKTLNSMDDFVGRAKKD